MEMNYDFLKDIETVNVNRVPAHSSHKSSNEKISLNGTWKMHYAKNLNTAPKGFQNNDYDISAFDNVTVPLSIEMQGYGHPAYNNFMYPWDGHEDLKNGEVPTEFNPTASYVKEFKLDKKNKGKRVFVSFQGAESGIAVWLNGKFIGYSEDSFTPHDFELTDAVDYDNINRLAVQTYRFTSSSWLEDQDFFRFSGLFRDVFVYFVPEITVFDIFAKGILNKDNETGKVDLEFTIKSPKKLNAIAEITVISGCREIVKQEIRVTDGVYNCTLNCDDVDAWSAEHPELYDLKITLKTEPGEIIEKSEQKIGFRRFEISNGVLTLNGKRIVFNGVNRHEMSADTGRTVSYADTERDIINMKRHNINAVRTCHYPDQTFFYDLCDKYGIYVIDECNLETHGTWSVIGRPTETTLPGSDPTWRTACLDRARSMQERDKNHACVLFWSCGNESCGGENIYLMSKLFKERDNTRLVHYEGICHERTYNETSDVESQMYTKPWDLRKFIEEHPEKPFILCEYMHAMGNSLGAMDEYTRMTHEIDKYQGGFIWDYIDQAFVKKNRYGEEYMGYGGDFGDKPNDYNFCGDGIVFADRTNSPKMQEVKYHYQNIGIKVNRYTAEITNYYLFTDLFEFNCFVTVLRNGETVNTEVKNVYLAPGETTEIKLFEDDSEYFDCPGEYTINVSFTYAYDTEWAEAGFEVAFGEYAFNVNTENAGFDMLCDNVGTALREVKKVDCDYNVAFHGDDFQYIFSKRNGGFLSMNVKGKEFFSLSPKPNFWRAPTDNDMGNNNPARLGKWKIASDYAGISDFKAEGNRITMKYRLPEIAGAELYVSYTVHDNGIIKVDMDYKGVKDMPDIPEFGLMFTLPADYENVRYYGEGPDECMLDRRMGARLGVYEFKSSENVTPYLMPQECGNRTGVRFAQITDRLGHGILFAGNDFEMSVLPFTPNELENAKHMYELPDIHYTIIRINKIQMGVGGDDSWGARTHDKYLIKSDGEMHFEFFIAGI